MPKTKRSRSKKVGRTRVGDLSVIAHKGLRQRVRRDIKRLIQRRLVVARRSLIKVDITDPRYVVVHLRSSERGNPAITRMHHRNKLGMVLVDARNDRGRTIYIVEQRNDAPNPVLAVPGGNIEGDERHTAPHPQEILYSGLRELEEEAGHINTDDSRFGWDEYGETVKFMVGTIRTLAIDMVVPINGTVRGIDPCVTEVLTDPVAIRRRLAAGIEPANPFVRYLLLRDGILRTSMKKVVRFEGYRSFEAERKLRLRRQSPKLPNAVVMAGDQHAARRAKRA